MKTDPEEEPEDEPELDTGAERKEERTEERFVDPEDDTVTKVFEHGRHMGF